MSVVNVQNVSHHVHVSLIASLRVIVTRSFERKKKKKKINNPSRVREAVSCQTTTKHSPRLLATLCQPPSSHQP